MKGKFWLILLSVLMIAGLALTACQPKATETAAPVEAAPTEAVAAPTEVPATEVPPTEVPPTAVPEPVTLVSMDTSGFYTLDIFLTPWFTASQAAMYDVLVDLTPDGKQFEGILAESWEVAGDNLSMTFKLKDGVTFHDGTPWNADAALWNLNKYLDPDWPKEINPSWPDVIASFEKVDDMSFKVTFNNPDATFLANLSGTYMVSPTAYEALGFDNFGLSPIGTGAWIPTEIVPNDHVTFKRNPDYFWGGAWTEGKPAAADFFKIVYNNDEAVAYAALETGEVTFIGLPAQFLVNAASNPDIVINKGTDWTLYYLGINHKKEIFQVPEFRQAIAHAIERDEFILAAFEGEAYKTCQYLPVGTPGYNIETDAYACEKWNYDPELSNQILDDLGWLDTNGDGVRERDGVELVFPIIYATEEAIGRGAEVLQGQLADIGIGLDLQPTEAAAQAEILVAEQQDFFIRPYGLSDALILSMMVTYVVDASGNLLSGNRNAYNDAHAQELSKIADSTLDPTARKAAVDDLNRYLIDNLAWFPIWTPYNYTGYRAEVQGATFNFAGGLLIHKCTIVK